MNFFILFTTIFMMLSTGYNKKPDLILSTYELSQIDGISMNIIDVDSKTITLEFTNNSDSSLTYGHLFTIEVEKGNTWYEMPLIRDDIAFTLEALLLMPGGTSESNIYYTNVYGTLPPGKYRIVKAVSLSTASDSNKKYYLCSEFTIE